MPHLPLPKLEATVTESGTSERAESSRAATATRVRATRSSRRIKEEAVDASQPATMDESDDTDFLTALLQIKRTGEFHYNNAN